MVEPSELVWLKQQLAHSYPLDPEAAAAIVQLPFTMRSYEANQYVLREGDRPRVSVFLRSGVVFGHKIVANGGRQIVAIHIAGDFVDAQNILLGESDHNIQTLTPVCVLSIANEILLDAAVTYPSIAKALWRNALKDASVTREWVANIGRRDGRARTAHMLCELAVRYEAAGLGARTAFDLPMTQEQLGDALGLTAVHVNRTLKSLEAEGLIVRDKRSVSIASWNGLQRAGDFTSSYLHIPKV